MIFGGNLFWKITTLAGLGFIRRELIPYIYPRLSLAAGRRDGPAPTALAAPSLGETRHRRWAAEPGVLSGPACPRLETQVRDRGRLLLHNGARRAGMINRVLTHTVRDACKRLGNTEPA